MCDTHIAGEGLSGGGLEEDVWLGVGGGESDCVVLVKGVDCLVEVGEEAAGGLGAGGDLGMAEEIAEEGPTFCLLEERVRLALRGGLISSFTQPAKPDFGREGWGGRGVLEENWQNVKIRIYHVLG